MSTRNDARNATPKTALRPINHHTTFYAKLHYNKYKHQNNRLWKANRATDWRGHEYDAGSVLTVCRFPRQESLKTCMEFRKINADIIIVLNLIKSKRNRSYQILTFQNCVTSQQGNHYLYARNFFGAKS